MMWIGAWEVREADYQGLDHPMEKAEDQFIICPYNVLIMFPAVPQDGLRAKVFGDLRGLYHSRYPLIFLFKLLFYSIEKHDSHGLEQGMNSISEGTILAKMNLIN